MDQDEPELNKKSLCILYIEDNPVDFLLVQRLLAQITKEEGDEHFELESADRLSKGLERLAKGGVDLVLTDLNLPDTSELQAVTKLRSKFPMLPIIALTNAYSKGLGLEAVKKGAQDYLLKDEMTGRMIKQSVLYAIERKRLEKIKDEFVCTVSHELKTPLTVIKGGVRLLRKGSTAPPSPEHEEILMMMDRNLDRLEQIIHDILDLSRLESGHSTINRLEVNLKQIIHEVVTDFNKEVIKNHIVIEECIPILPKVFADPNLIIRVLNNLLGNAHHFARNKIEITAIPVNSAICVRVIDDGPGIAAENQKKLFNKFVQINRSVSEKNYKGSGLGLAICKEIIKQHEGSIWIESEPSLGSQFCFTIPRSNES